ncbi:hypothetical protein DL93DRAFT_2234638 [Clavulina sp. PMI_390]|nr:hypothetical protein DL93DRAFT_2234638 [Clavulina sp. PMI_390]
MHATFMQAEIPPAPTVHTAFVQTEIPPVPTPLPPIIQSRTLLTSMPPPFTSQAPKFKGRDVRLFLSQFNGHADGAGLTDAERCARISSYCTPKIQDVVQTLPQIAARDWIGVQNQIYQLYDPEGRRDKYSRMDLVRFSGKSRKIRNATEYAQY